MSWFCRKWRWERDFIGGDGVLWLIFIGPLNWRKSSEQRGRLKGEWGCFDGGGYPVLVRKIGVDMVRFSSWRMAEGGGGGVKTWEMAGRECRERKVATDLGEIAIKVLVCV